MSHFVGPEGLPSVDPLRRQRAPLSANAAVVQAGFDFGLSRHTRLRAGYDGVLAGSRDSAVNVTFQMTF